MRIPSSPMGGALGAVTILLSGLASTVLAREHDEVDYAAAERYLPQNADRYVVNGHIQHHWIGGEDRFWYQRSLADGSTQFVVVDARTGRTRPAFDHAKIAAAISSAAGKPVDGGALPFQKFSFGKADKTIVFDFKDQTWTCVLRVATCDHQPPVASADEVLSPNGKWALSRKDGNLWARATDGSAPFPLSTDGQEFHEYAGLPGDSTKTITLLRAGKDVPPQALWSPDSRYVLTYRLDERLVKSIALIDSVPPDGSNRPRLYQYRYAMPGDANVPLAQPVIFDVRARRMIEVATEPNPSSLMTFLTSGNGWWSSDGHTAYFLDFDRYSKSVKLKSIVPSTGQVREIVRETSPTFLQAADVFHLKPPSVRVLSNGDVVWYSQRSGWGHFYYYTADGTLRGAITSGDWTVREIVRVDEAGGKLYFTASGREKGRDPYYRHLYRVNLDGSALELLTPENADHDITTFASRFHGVGVDFHDARIDENSLSPSGRYVVHQYSRPDLPPTTVLQSADGKRVRTLEEADISGLRNAGYMPPEPFEVTSADGVTKIYGNLFRPSTFDPEKTYPVIDAIYPGPQFTRSIKTFNANFENARAVAELGFIVVTVDGRGTPFRSKMFQDDSYGRLDKAGNLEDHIAAIRQLAGRYPYMDTSRVGIFGGSGGGYASTHAMLAHPDFYKVAVSIVGNHDQRHYLTFWGDTFNGPEGNYLDSSNVELAGRLEGKLLLVHGEIDDNVHPSQTIRLVDALIRHNKDFDMLILPGANHGGSVTSPYFTKRMWDYFVENLAGKQPPKGYVIAGGGK